MRIGFVCSTLFLAGEGFTTKRTKYTKKIQILFLGEIQDKMDVIHHEEMKKHEVEKELGVSFGGGFLFVLLLAGGRCLVFKGRGFD